MRNSAGSTNDLKPERRRRVKSTALFAVMGRRGAVARVYGRGQGGQARLALDPVSIDIEGRSVPWT